MSMKIDSDKVRLQELLELYSTRAEHHKKMMNSAKAMCRSISKNLAYLEESES